MTGCHPWGTNALPGEMDLLTAYNAFILQILYVDIKVTKKKRFKSVGNCLWF